MLIARDSGVAVIFEAKVLSDASISVTFDIARRLLTSGAGSGERGGTGVQVSGG